MAEPAAFGGAVLCGGASRRMGRDKALIPLDGRPLAVRVAGALHAAGARPVIAVGGARSALGALGLRTTADLHPGAGPLGGVLTAFAALAEHDTIAVLACDLLWPNPAAVQALVAAAGAPGTQVAVPLVGGRLQYHHAVWRRDAEPALAAAFAHGQRSLRGAVAGLRLVAVTTVDPRAVRDADQPQDLADGAGSAPLPRWVVPPPIPSERRPVAEEEEQVEVPEIDVDELESHHATGAAVFDVRQPDEYVDAHVPGATLVPLATVPDELATFPTDQAVYVICAGGGRSRRAAEFLRANGVDAINVAGGTRAWVEAGKSVATGPEAG
jgi:molybdopterin-guanine dinucleotide biosynthesis protein A/rhodanese-related sulfurtransferase